MMVELVKTRMEPVHVFNMEELVVGDIINIKRLVSSTFDADGNVLREHYDIDGKAYIEDIWEDELTVQYLQFRLIITPQEVVDGLWTIKKVGANNG